MSHDASRYHFHKLGIMPNQNGADIIAGALLHVQIDSLKRFQVKDLKQNKNVLFPLSSQRRFYVLRKHLKGAIVIFPFYRDSSIAHL